MPTNIDRARAAGFIDYVTKPFDVSHLLALIDGALKHISRTDSVASEIPK